MTLRRGTFSRRGYGRFKCHRMLIRVDWRIFTEILEESNVFVFNVKNPRRQPISLGDGTVLLWDFGNRVAAQKS